MINNQYYLLKLILIATVKLVPIDNINSIVYYLTSIILNLLYHKLSNIHIHQLNNNKILTILDNYNNNNTNNNNTTDNHNHHHHH